MQLIALKFFLVAFLHVLGLIATLYGDACPDMKANALDEIVF